MMLDREPEEVQKLYGLDQPETKEFGRQCLAARRMAEQGVRFIQIFHGSNGGAGAWDAHSDLAKSHPGLCKQVDKPIAGLLADLKRTGLLDDTLVVWGSEFGRTPGRRGAPAATTTPTGSASGWPAAG
jgi:arylsulfatase A-like enzyme